MATRRCTFAANGLGVSVRDLGLSLADYVLLTAVLVLYMALLFGVILAMPFVVARLPQAPRRLLVGRWQSRVPWAAGLVLIVLSFVFRWGGVAALAVWIAVNLGRSVDFAIEAESGTGRLQVRWVFILALAVGVVLLTTFVSSHSWAEGVRDFAKTGKDAPAHWLTPSQALNPQIGVAAWGTHRECVVRVGDRVLLAKSGTLVVPRLDEFMPTKCKVVDKFTVGTTTTTTSTTTTSTQPATNTTSGLTKPKRPR